MKCSKNNCNTNQLNKFSQLDLRSEQRYVQERTECYRPPKLNNNNAFRKQRRKPRTQTNSDCSDLDIAFDRKVNDFTNPRSSQNQRLRCCPQDFEMCPSNFIMDYNNSEIRNGNKLVRTRACCNVPSITGGIKPALQCPQCYNWNTCNDCNKCRKCKNCFCN